MFRRFLPLLLAAACARSAQLRVMPERLELTGRDPVHGVLVLLAADDGRVSDVTRHAVFATDAPHIATVDARARIAAAADGLTTLNVRLDSLSSQIAVQVTR